MNLEIYLNKDTCLDFNFNINKSLLVVGEYKTTFLKELIRELKSNEYSVTPYRVYKSFNSNNYKKISENRQMYKNLFSTLLPSKVVKRFVYDPTWVNYNSFSSGEKRIFLLLTHVNLSKEDFIVIDDIELHLSVEVCRKIIKTLIDVFPDKIFIISTVNPVAIRKFKGLDVKVIKTTEKEIVIGNFYKGV